MTPCPRWFPAFSDLDSNLNIILSSPWLKLGTQIRLVSGWIPGFSSTCGLNLFLLFSHDSDFVNSVVLKDAKIGCWSLTYSKMKQFSHHLSTHLNTNKVAFVCSFLENIGIGRREGKLLGLGQENKSSFWPLVQNQIRNLGPGCKKVNVVSKYLYLAHFIRASQKPGNVQCQALTSRDSGK